MSEMAGEKVKTGPPFRPMNSWPSNWKRTVSTDPFGRPDAFAAAAPW